MKFKCFKCNKRILVELHNRQRKVRCPKCRTKYLAPSENDAESGRKATKLVEDQIESPDLSPPRTDGYGQGVKPKRLNTVQPSTNFLPCSRNIASIPKAKTLKNHENQIAEAQIVEIENGRSPARKILSVGGLVILIAVFAFLVFIFANPKGYETEAWTLEDGNSLSKLNPASKAGDPLEVVSNHSKNEVDSESESTSEHAAATETDSKTKILPNTSESKTGKSESVALGAFGKPNEGHPEQHDSDQYFRPKFPELRRPYTREGYSTYLVRFRDVVENAKFLREKLPSRRMELRIWVPENHVEGAKIPLVLVAPAGSNLMHGLQLPNEKYLAEAMPYVESGMMVCQFSIDGLKPQGRIKIPLMKHLFFMLQNADGGVINGRVALDYVLKNFPDVDQERIYLAGHSSAGTLSLQLASAEPRIRKCAAFAPVCFLDRRLKPVLDDPLVVKEIEHLEDYVKNWSPHQRVEHFECPVFVFHSKEDSNEPWENSKDFVGLMRQTGKEIQLVTSPTGGHYESMINQGIPEAIKWFREDEQ